MNLESAFSAFDEKKSQWRVIIETPLGSHNKYSFDPEHGVFMLSMVLPAGMTFPFDFGFLPSTLGEDGDPLDVLLLNEQPAFSGCLVMCRLLGVIEARQTERDGKSERNDRLVAVPCEARNFNSIETVKDLDKRYLDEIEQFFVTYNHLHDKQFKILNLLGPKRAVELAREGMKRFGLKGAGKLHKGKTK